MIAFLVVDDGPGIPMEQRQRAFEMFRTGARNKDHGTGIGLALVRKLVEHAGGEVAIIGEDAPGAKVRFTWPREALPVAETATPAAAE
ncbi:MAG: sensor histidine kinase, partial [Planctomycetes bacterium]|nr:sensor histidine kinase [Planctomycetota bacterium]